MNSLIVIDATCYDFPMLDWNNCHSVERHADKVSGAWLFRGTRIPVTALFVSLRVIGFHLSEMQRIVLSSAFGTLGMSAASSTLRGFIPDAGL